MSSSGSQEDRPGSTSGKHPNSSLSTSSDIATSSLKFAPFRSFVDSAFFHELSHRKLNDLKLDESQIPIYGTYSTSPIHGGSDFASLSVSKSSFFTDDLLQFEYTTPAPYLAPGSLLTVNTIETFKNWDRAKLIRDKQQEICDSILSGTAVKNPSILSAFQILMYCDLKKYSYYYWFAFPAPLIDWKSNNLSNKTSLFNVSTELFNSIESWRKSVSEDQWGFFLLRKAVLEDETRWEVSKIEEYEKFLQTDAKEDEHYLVFSDPSPYELVPGWPLRNFLLLAFHLRLFEKFPNLNVLAYRGRTVSKSPKETNPELPPTNSFIIKGLATSTSAENINSLLLNVPKAAGWERLPTTGKLSPKYTNLGSLIDPIKLADQAVDLNLKLMKWRIAPNLDLDIVKNTRCLLLGAGTLGSYIARGLLGWGVRSITFVDSGNVSYSNPVRQPLYTFEDCNDGGKPKAECAAEALKKIYPSIESRGVKLEIPMAGHAVHDEATQKTEYEILHDLIKEHDVVFLLMDSREARWLPTVMCAAMGKLVINAALGFDSYVVMRHGVLDNNDNTMEEQTSPTPHLGCYFCNDVVAPLDSMSNRTLDQMCTVTRPGVAMLASANAVEILVSLLQHPLKGLAPAPKAATVSSSDSEAEQKVSAEDLEKAAFGYYIPHQLRGFLGSFESMKITGPAYPSCSACSSAVRNEWKNRGWEFVKDALNNPKYVEDLAGLTEIQEMTEQLDFGLSDGDDEWALSD